MNLVFVCLSADASDPVHATTVRWIDTLAGRPEIAHLTVLAHDAGELPVWPNVTVRVFRGRGRIGTAWRFYAEVARAMRGGVDAFFVHQGGPYPVLLWPIKLWRRIPVYYWKAHPHISVWTWLSARFVATKVFTPTPASLPLALPRLVIVGHGIDVAQFSRSLRPPPHLDLVTTGRVSPVKRLDVMVRALARCNDRFGTRFRLDIYGPTIPRDDGYRRQLEHLIDELGLSDLVVLRGAVDQAELPGILSAYRLFLNFSNTALDKAAAEAMACGLLVLSTNPAVEEILPPSMRSQLIAPADDADAQADAIHGLMTLGEPQRADLAAALRELIVSDHNLEVLIGRILREMDGRR